MRALAPRYAHVSKDEKGQILDQVCEVTDYTRKYALTLLKDPPDEPPVKRTRRRSPSYGAAEVELLRLCWLVTDGICANRLAPFLPELLRRLRRWHALREVPADVQARVAGMSAAPIDRALRPSREQATRRRGLSTPQAGTLLKRQIALRTFADWAEARPGFREMDSGGPLRLERRRRGPGHAEPGGCGLRLGRLRRPARQAGGDGLLGAPALTDGPALLDPGPG